jgi:hypothetical protein
MAALKPGGFLATGAHEHLPVHTDHLDRDHGCPWIYRYAASPRERYSGAGIGLRIINRGRLGVPRNVKTMTIQRRLCKVNPVPEQGHGWWPSCFSFGFSRLKDHKIFFTFAMLFAVTERIRNPKRLKPIERGGNPLPFRPMAIHPGKESTPQRVITRNGSKQHGGSHYGKAYTFDHYVDIGNPFFRADVSLCPAGYKNRRTGQTGRSQGL